MALSDPQSLTINSVANSTPRVGTLGTTSTYQSADGSVKLTVSHSNAKRTRRTVRVDFNKIAPDPLVDANSIRYSMSAYLVVDLPMTGFTGTEAKYIVDALTGWLNASSGANTIKFLGGES